MALEQLLLSKRINQRSAQLVQLRADEAKLKEDEKNLEDALDEAKTDDEVNAVEDSATELEKKIKANADEIAKLEQEKTDLEAKLAEIEGDDEKNKKGEGRNMAKKVQTRGKEVMSIRESLQIEEVRNFYQGIANAMTEKRALTGTEKVVPLEVIDRIESKLGDYSTLINEVTVEKIGGTGRAVIAGDIPEAIWFEIGKEALSELEDELQGVEFDGYGLGGYVSVPNIIIENSLINLAAHVEDRLAKAIAKALDKAILNGTGTKQPKGVTVSAPTENKVASDGTITDLIAKLATVDTDGTGGEVIAVMNRATYYSKIVPKTLAVAANGVLTGSYALPFRVVLCAYAAANTVVFGDFKQFLLAKRSEIRVESSTDFQFTSDNTVFKGVGFYDGKATKPKAFSVVTIESTPDQG
ncbi:MULTISPECIES: phage major capsid protein [unclassified Enterococcus]|uniref:phage major capsid protein n=1 Tax=unclassified Enterococcus TaxID=2608891 RepID=UPI0015564682|nr:MULTISPECIES: phage major capsid protein [unclassified Enterococcus]MBS7578451.1 phage major capsid protein [Enterococcus sp. MMGLQ5-2]MBS7585684.1 phage major capsid protein [Enterococcus sp. MMGLQ5-1]NPD13543.1 phage major capsid protein [Enterococcus sp. MMGLQ5-1]NPD38283.1 phage major capsid protein [Enterococcus sp. MMGLQ5-2]